MKGSGAGLKRLHLRTHLIWNNQRLYIFAAIRDDWHKLINLLSIYYEDKNKKYYCSTIQLKWNSSRKLLQQLENVTNYFLNYKRKPQNKGQQYSFGPQATENSSLNNRSGS